MSGTDHAALRTQLEEERDDAAARLDGLTADGAAAPEFDENFADAAQVSAEQGENQALAASLRDQLADVEHAISRLDDGSYGTCEECGKAIGAARIEAMPATRFCIEHA
jgi:DnaK suppressor protein